MQDLEGKTAVVIGASSGIGLALAQALGRQGMNLVMAASRAGRLEAAAAAVQDTTSTEVMAVTCDVADDSSVQSLAERAYAEFGEVNLLCNNAAVTTLGPLAQHQPEDWEWVYRVNVMGVVNAIHTFLPSFIAQGGGHIMNTGSVMGIIPDAIPDYGPYTSAKAAVASLTLMLREEVALAGVEVSLFVPGGVKSGLTSRANDRGPVKPGDWTLRFNSAADLAIRTAREAADLTGGGGYMSAEANAELAIAGIKANDPIIMAPKWLKPAARGYFERVLAAFDEGSVC